MGDHDTFGPDGPSIEDYDLTTMNHSRPRWFDDRRFILYVLTYGTLHVDGLYFLSTQEALAALRAIPDAISLSNRDLCLGCGNLTRELVSGFFCERWDANTVRSSEMFDGVHVQEELWNCLGWLVVTYREFHEEHSETPLFVWKYFLAYILPLTKPAKYYHLLSKLILVKSTISPSIFRQKMDLSPHLIWIY